MAAPRDPLTNWIQSLDQDQWRAWLSEKIMSIESQCTKTNGRVTALEDASRSVKADLAIREAYKAGSKTALVTKGQWKAVAAIFAAVGMVAGSIGAVVALIVVLAQ